MDTRNNSEGSHRPSKFPETNIVLSKIQCPAFSGASSIPSKLQKKKKNKNKNTKKKSLIQVNLYDIIKWEHALKNHHV
ncbi:uncharacterized protein J3R85_021180 [Psidium guajava]|nr:uncharacterized protein J3R85_021180 [Psidium guajava]